MFTKDPEREKGLKCLLGTVIKAFDCYDHDIKRGSETAWDGFLIHCISEISDLSSKQSHPQAINKGELMVAAEYEILPACQALS